MVIACLHVTVCHIKVVASSDELSSPLWHVSASFDALVYGPRLHSQSFVVCIVFSQRRQKVSVKRL